jgi:aspartate-semialdehyde dehydrogenase
MPTATNGKRPVNLAILGATGLVGTELLKILEERNFPIGKLKLLASERSKDATIQFKGKEYPVEVATKDSFKNIDIVLSAAGAAIKDLAPAAVDSGAIVIDKSSAFRMNPEVPLVVPGVNDSAVHDHQGIIASPNCSTAQLVVPLKILHDLAGITRVIASTYQSVSGAGSAAMEELQMQTHNLLHKQPIEPKVFTKQIAFNVIPHIDKFNKDGYTKEEEKLIEETKKILGLPQLAITCTAVRVPVSIGHSESVLIEFARQITVEQARNAFAASDMIELWDNTEDDIYPTPIDAAGKDPVYVGRIRKDNSSPNALHIWVVADNLRIGAALNAIRIAEYLLEHKLLRQPVAS